MNPKIQNSLKYNLTVNILDGGFFGFALGFASFVTILPLFVSTMTESAVLIGLIPAIHSAGWQFPQILTVRRVSKQSRLKPMVLTYTIHERLPFLALAVVAWFVPFIGRQTALILTFVLLAWQSIGGGFTATAWQSLIGKIIPSEIRGTFFGSQSAFAYLLASLSAILAGLILVKMLSPTDFAVCFLLAFFAMVISWVFLAMTREPESIPAQLSERAGSFWSGLKDILDRDRNFRWFLAGRMLSQFALMGSAFYTVYAVRYLGISEAEIGWMTGVLMAVQIVANPVMGWLGDRWNRRAVMSIGLSASTLSAILAMLASEPWWFYLVFSLIGITNVAVWTVGLAMIQEFGTEGERPAYIGLGNTLVAPANFLAPILGGWLAEFFGYPATFLAAAIGGLASALIFQTAMTNPSPDRTSIPTM